MKSIIGIGASALILSIAMTTGCAYAQGDSLAQGEAGQALQIVESSMSRTEDDHAYGVFLGLEPENAQKMYGYHRVVVDAQIYTKKQIDELHERGMEVYSYINVGSLEEWRTYYPEFVHATRDRYDGWPDESWMDVTDEGWQEFIVHHVAKECADKQVDGFFIDNLDVYGLYKTEAAKEALLSILSGLKQYQRPIMINGGDEFVTEMISEGRTDLFSAVNQESAFTSENPEDREYYQDYLKRCKQNGIAVYVLEYTADSDEIERIKALCKELGYHYYFSANLELN